MVLKGAALSKIEDAIFRTGIPYDDVKVELVDHIASVVEYKMEENPELSFGDALSIASIGAKDTILSIRASIRKNTIQKMIEDTYNFSNMKDFSLILFFASIAFMIFMANGQDGDAVILSYLAIPFITLVILWMRLWRVKPKFNYRLTIRKRYAWLPILFIAGLGLFVSTLCLSFYHSWFENLKFFIMSVSYGFLMKTVIDTLIFNIHDLKESIEVNDIFLPELV